jgi:hypothetical protein
MSVLIGSPSKRRKTCLTAAQDGIGLTPVVVACCMQHESVLSAILPAHQMLQAPYNMRYILMLSCANHLKVKACFMLHADTHFLRLKFISKLNQCLKRICFLQMGLLKHEYSLILVLCMKRILD